MRDLPQAVSRVCDVPVELLVPRSTGHALLHELSVVFCKVLQWS